MIGISNSTLIGQRATTFARGLYHIASCDGFHQRERDALSHLLSELNTDLTVDDLAEPVFDYGKAAIELDSMWLRRTFIQACRIMVQMDGKISLIERDALRAMASALGIGEDFALQGLDGYPSPTEIAEWVDSLEVDFVAWDDICQPGYLWFFPHPSHPVAFDATIHVYEGQALAIRHNGVVTDLLKPGTYRATPQYLPGFAAASGWQSGAQRMELLFVRTGPSPMLRWGLASGAKVTTDTHGPFVVRAYGRCSLAFQNVPAALHRFAGSHIPDSQELEQRLGRIVAGRFGQALEALVGRSDLDTVRLLSDLDLLRDTIAPEIRQAIDGSGLRMVRFQIENLTVPLETGIRPTSTRTMTRIQFTTEDETKQTTKALAQTDEAAAIYDEHGIQGSPIGCVVCGATDRYPCPKCGTQLRSDETVCPKCGTPRVG